jgi:hypothetical protein
MIASEIVAQRKQSNVDRHPPLAAIVSMPGPVASAWNGKRSPVAFLIRQVHRPPLA